LSGISYQWYKDDTAISDKTSITYSKESATSDDSGVYGYSVFGLKVADATVSVGDPIPPSVELGDGSTAVFDKNDPKDIVLNLSLQRFTLESANPVRIGNALALIESEGYTVDGNAYTIKKEVLVKLGEGQHQIIFALAGEAANIVFNFEVTDSSTSDNEDGVEAVLTLLQAAIDQAPAVKTDVAISVDGTEVETTDKWVTQTEMDAFDAAILSAQAVADKSDATIEELVSAITNVNIAKYVFENAQKDGLKTDGDGDDDDPGINDTYTGGPSTDPVWNDANIFVDKQNMKVYSTGFNVVYGGAATLNLTSGGSTTINLSPSRESYNLKSGCGCYGIIDDPVPPQECGAGAACGTAATLGFCGCDGTTVSYPVTLGLENIKGSIVGAPLSGVATATFDIATGELIISGVSKGTTTVAVEAIIHNTAVDAKTALTTDIDDDYVAYRYSLPLVLTINVDGGYTPSLALVKAELESAIDSATSAASGIAVSIDGSEFEDSVQWVTEAVKDTYLHAIANAQTALDASDATVDSIQTAHDALQASTTAFVLAQSAGTKVESGDGGLTQAKADLTSAISSATAAASGIAVSIDGSEFEDSVQWVTQTVKDAYIQAIADAQTALDASDATVTSIQTAISDLATATGIFASAQNPGTKPTEAAKFTGTYKVSTSHGGTPVWNEAMGAYTDDQYVLIEIPFDKNISLNNAQALIDSLNMSIGSLSNKLTATPSDVKVLDDGKTLRLRMHIAAAAFSGQVIIEPKNGNVEGLTTENVSGVAVDFPHVDLFVSNGVTLLTIPTAGTASEHASLTVNFNIPENATRGMIHMLFTSNDTPVASLNSYGGNLITHFHNYLELDAVGFAELVVGYFNGSNRTDYGSGATSDEFTGYYAVDNRDGTITIFADNAVEGEVLGLSIVGYPSAGDVEDDFSVNPDDENKNTNDPALAKLKTELTIAISVATAELNSIIISADGKDVDPANKWVTAAAATAYNQAIAAAQTALSANGATALSIQIAKDNLAAAKAAFALAQSAGLKPAAPGNNGNDGKDGTDGKNGVDGKTTTTTTTNNNNYYTAPPSGTNQDTVTPEDAATDESKVIAEDKVSAQGNTTLGNVPVPMADNSGKATPVLAAADNTGGVNLPTYAFVLILVFAALACLAIGALVMNLLMQSGKLPRRI
jgi:hypothetical protein